MRLVCKICSGGGTRTPGSDNIIADIDTAKLALPLTPEMFKPLKPERGQSFPWRPGADWQHMFCPFGRHLPWGLSMDDAVKAMRQGGPSVVLTDEGEVVISAARPVEAVADTEPPVSVTKEPKAFTCKTCGKSFTRNWYLHKHIQAEHK